MCPTIISIGTVDSVWLGYVVLPLSGRCVGYGCNLGCCRCMVEDEGLPLGGGGMGTSADARQCVCDVGHALRDNS